MDTQNHDLHPEEREQSAEEKRLRYMSDEERREWSGVSEWRDPLEKEQPEPDEHDGKFAMASLFCGIAALLTLCTGYVNAIFGAAAVICGIIAKKKQESADKTALIGIIFGIIGIGVALVLLLIRLASKMSAPDVLVPAPTF